MTIEWLNNDGNIGYILHEKRQAGAINQSVLIVEN